MPKNAEKYTCEECDFKCSKLSNYTSHLSTAKHKILTNPNKNLTKTAAAYKCICGTEFPPLKKRTFPESLSAKYNPTKINVVLYFSRYFWEI